MKWVRKALIASPVLFGFAFNTVELAFADDTRPSAPSTRDDWYRQDSQPAAPDAARNSDPNSPPRRDAGPGDRDLRRDGNVFANSTGGGNGGSGTGGNLSDYPGRDVHDWVFAGANAATARAIFR